MGRISPICGTCVQGDYARRQDNFVWLVSRFGDWKYGCWREAKYFPMFFRRNAQLWLDGFDEVKGFVLSEDGENVFFIFTREGYDHLYGDILDWTIANWGPRYDSLVAEVNEGQTHALAALARRGLSAWVRRPPRVPTTWPSKLPPALPPATAAGVPRREHRRRAGLPRQAECAAQWF